jgi:hypothetical protein
MFTLQQQEAILGLKVLCCCTKWNWIIPEGGKIHELHNLQQRLLFFRKKFQL